MDVNSVSALVVAALASATDVRSRRIPNVLTFGAALVAVAFAAATGGARGLVMALAGWVVGLLLYMPLFALGGMGAGDIKLLAALGAWLGPWMAVWVALYAAVAGGVMAVVLALRRQYLRTAWNNVWLLLAHWRVSGIRPMPELTLERGRGPRLAYAVPIAVGTAVALWARS